MNTWEQINNKRIKHIRFGERLFYRMYSEFRNDLSGRLQRVQTPEEISGVVERFGPNVDVKDYFVKFYVRTGMDFARKNYTHLKSEAGKLERKDLNADLRESSWLDLMLKFVTERCGNRIERIYWSEVDDIVRIARQAIGAGINNGWGADKIVNEMMKEIRERDRWKALRIARTEVVSASNEGAHLGAREAIANGIELDKVWLATGYPGPSGFMRDDHDAMNETRVGFEEPFILPDGTYMEFPGDPNAPGKHTINCRCSVGHIPKKGTDIVAQELGEI